MARVYELSESPIIDTIAVTTTATVIIASGATTSISTSVNPLADDERANLRRNHDRTCDIVRLRISVIDSNGNQARIGASIGATNGRRVGAGGEVVRCRNRSFSARADDSLRSARSLVVGGILLI